MKSIRILGVMTGTSCDALDAACLEIEADSWSLLWSASQSYPEQLRKRVFNLQRPDQKTSLKELLDLDRDLGEWYGDTLIKLIKKHSKPDVIANHGQTVAHFPHSQGRGGTTLQIGEPSRIARATRLTVVSHFRNGDMAAGGQGAPLVPIFHKILAHQLSKTGNAIAIHNLGGISNLTYIGPKDQILAFDTGPGNVWIDAAAAKSTNGKWKFDRDGKLSIQAEPDPKDLSALLKHPYFALPPPKSTGRDDFPPEYFFSKIKSKNKTTWVSTAVALTAETIARAYEKWIIKKGLPLQTIYLSGGGANNPTLQAYLAARLPRIKVSTLVEVGFDPAYIEAQAFALLGMASLMGSPVGGSWTGSTGFAPPGQIVPGENWDQVIAKVQSLLNS